MKAPDNPPATRPPGFLHRLSVLMFFGGLIVCWSPRSEGVSHVDPALVGGTIFIVGAILGIIDSVRRKDFPRNELGGP